MEAVSGGQMIANRLVNTRVSDLGRIVFIVLENLVN